MGEHAPVRGPGDDPAGRQEAPGETAAAKPCLFVSYRRSQKERVEPVVRALEAAGIDCFFDQDAIDPLADFPDRIRQGIGASHALLAWWSADYAASDHCMAEFKLAWQHARRLSSDVSRRVWVLNPEASADHIAVGELASQNFLAPPADGAIDAWVEPLRARLRALSPEGHLTSERQVAATPKLRNAPRPTATFTGRNAGLMRIHSKLHPAHIGAAGATVAVQTHGLGGIGKTELVAKYAHDFAHAYPGGVYWLNFAGFAPDGPVSEPDAHNAWLLALQQTFAGEPELTRDAEGKPLPARELRVALERRLGAEPYLWVLDNVPELSPLDRRATILAFWRAPGAAGRTLITTRDSCPAAGFAEERLDVLSADDALRLLARFRRPGREEMDAARELVADVGAHTLALTLIGEQLREAPGGYTGALAKLRATGRLDRIEALARHLQPLLGEKARGIFATFEVSITALDADARALLAVAAVCAPNEPIPVPLLAACMPDEDEFASALSRLLRASLLTRRRGREEGGEPVEIHPLVADAVVWRLAMPAEELAEALARPLLRLVNAAGDILAHDQALADAMRQAGHFASWLHSKAGIILSLQLGHYHSARGLYPLARVANEQALALARKVLGEQDPGILTCMNDLAVTLYALGDLARARALQEQVLASRRELLGERHPDTLGSMENLAVTLSELGDLARARALQEQALATRREVLGESHPDTLRSMSLLADTLSELGDLAGAQVQCEPALAVFRELQGERHPDTLRSMDSLAATLFRQGDLAGARTLQKRVLTLRRELQGERHPDTTVTAWNLLGTLWHLDAAEEAARVRDDHLAWLLDAAAECLDRRQRQIRDWLRGLGDVSRRRS